MLVEERLLGSAPALIVRPVDARLPAVLWFHGFGVGKETHEPELARFAAAGFAAIGIDAAGHGARRLPDLAERQAAPREEAKATMLELAAQTADETPAILDALIASHIADPHAIAVAGVSMGGYVVYRAMADQRVKAAVSILGAPELLRESAEHVALLSITAERDENVPPAEARRFHETRSGTHRYLEIANAGHLMNEAQWNEAIDATVAWLTPLLRAAPRDPAPPAAPA